MDDHCYLIICISSSLPPHIPDRPFSIIWFLPKILDCFLSYFSTASLHLFPTARISVLKRNGILWREAPSITTSVALVSFNGQSTSVPCVRVYRPCMDWNRWSGVEGTSAPANCCIFRLNGCWSYTPGIWTTVQGEMIRRLCSRLRTVQCAVKDSRVRSTSHSIYTGWVRDRQPSLYHKSFMNHYQCNTDDSESLRPLMKRILNRTASQSTALP